MFKIAQGITRFNLSKEHFYKCSIPFPTLPEQQKIASCLSSLDGQISAEQSRLESLSQHKRGLMQQLFPQEGETVPKLRFPGFEGEWKVKKLGEIAKNQDNKRKPVSKIERVTGEYPYYGANGIQDYVNDFIFDGEHLLIGEDGSVANPDGTPVLNWATGKIWVNNHAHVLSESEKGNLKYIFYALSTVNIQGLVTGIPPKLNQENLNSIKIPIPTLPEQQKIASCLTAIDDLIAAQQERIEALKQHKRGLMQQLFPAVANE